MKATYFLLATAISLLPSSIFCFPASNTTAEDLPSKRSALEQRFEKSYADGKSPGIPIHITIFYSKGCKGARSVNTKDLTLGHNYADTQGIQSVSIDRDLMNSEQLDFSTHAGKRGLDKNCALFMFSAPVAPNALTKGCWDLPKPADCWRLWMNPKYASALDMPSV